MKPLSFLLAVAGVLLLMPGLAGIADLWLSFFVGHSVIIPGWTGDKIWSAYGLAVVGVLCVFAGWAMKP